MLEVTVLLYSVYIQYLCSICDEVPVAAGFRDRQKTPGEPRHKIGALPSRRALLSKGVYSLPLPPSRSTIHVHVDASATPVALDNTCTCRCVCDRVVGEFVGVKGVFCQLRPQRDDGVVQV